jgi:phenylalanyl-tRNA synthetase alpha subunit
MTDLVQLESELTAKIAAADAAALEALRVAALGKTGEISNLLKSLGTMSPEERREQGPKSSARPSPPARPRWMPPPSMRASPPSGWT